MSVTILKATAICENNLEGFEELITGAASKGSALLERLRNCYELQLILLTLSWFPASLKSVETPSGRILHITFLVTVSLY